MKMIWLEKWFMNTARHDARAINRAERLLGHVPIGELRKYLEVGCGNGAVARHVAVEYGLDVTGVDVDPDQIRRAGKDLERIPDARFMTVDGTKLPFDDNEFDTVLSFGVMHHIGNWLDALAEINRVLKPGGYFVYADLIYPEWLAGILKKFVRKYGVTSLRALTEFLDNNNFTAVYAASAKAPIHFEAVCKKE